MNPEEYIADTQTVEVRESIQSYGGIDKAGPFLCASVERVKHQAAAFKNTRVHYVASDIEGYQCPVSGAWIEGRAAHRENLKVHDVHVLERGEFSHNEKRRLEESREETRRNVDRAVDDAARIVFNR